MVFDKPKEDVEQPQTPPAVTPEAEEQPSETEPTKEEKPEKDVPVTDTPVEDIPSQPSHDDEVVVPEVDPNYKEPVVDVIIGKNSESPQFGVLGKMVSNGRVIGMDLNECNTISLFGVQGAGKSYTIGSVTEMVLKQFSNVNKLPAPMAGVIFHFSESMDYAPEFTSMVYPNDEAGQFSQVES